MMTNSERAERGEAAVDGYLAYGGDLRGSFDTEELLHDVFTDLHHWAVGQGLSRRDVETTFGKAAQSYLDELAEDEEGGS
ncbi:hypothetical protein AB6B38_14570 (plasmid) [Glycocaulis abyssi]|jgi:hypothetical protein|uniref:Uncharacterized protein n=1 Tax=Glycocaulis abyssi TaxID=1433403 RepID=A0ABV9NEW4_9PROT|nr:hypothetical protein [Oceanicaulis sp.]